MALVTSHFEFVLFSNELGSVEVGTVDSFQGREKDVIFFSSVRANSENQIG